MTELVWELDRIIGNTSEAADLCNRLTGVDLIFRRIALCDDEQTLILNKRCRIFNQGRKRCQGPCRYNRELLLVGPCIFLKSVMNSMGMLDTKGFDK